MAVRTQNTKILQAIVGGISVDVVQRERQPFAQPAVETAAFTSRLLQARGNEPLTQLATVGVGRVLNQDLCERSRLVATSASYLDTIDRDAQRCDCWTAAVDEQPSAFVIVDRRSVAVAEILWMATVKASRRRGVGTALFTHVLAELSGTGVQLVEVKTLDASAGYEPYESTHAFWRKLGFVQIDTIDPLPGLASGQPRRDLCRRTHGAA